MHVVLGTPMSLRRHMPVVSSALLALAFVLLPAVAPAQTVTFNGIGTVLASNVDYPTAVAVDSHGNMYVTAVNYSQVLKVTPAGASSVVSTGSLTAPAGSICGTALCYPEALAVDSAGDLYIADTRNSRIVEVTTAGAVSVLNIASVPAGFGCTTNVCSPDGLAVDSAGDLYIADATNGRVVELTAAGAGSVVSTGSLTVPAGSPCGTVLCGPSGLAVDSAGDLYIADNGNSRVVEITAAGVASVLNVGTPGGVALSYPYGVAVDGSGDVYIADFPNERIVEVAVGGASSVVGAVYCSSANYCDPFAVAADSAGDVFIGDGGNERVMEVSPNVNFGNVTVSSAKTANQQTMGYTFVADDTLTAVNVLTQGASGQDYTADPSSTCVAGGTYGPSSTATCTVVADLSPAVPGLRMGAV